MRVDWLPAAERLPDEIENILVTVQIPDEGGKEK